MKDTVNHRHGGAVGELLKKCIVKGKYADQFGINDTLKRGEAAKIFARILKLALPDINKLATASSTKTSPFTDLKDSEWEAYVTTLYHLGIIPAGTIFRPNDFMKTEDVLDILRKSLDLIGEPRPSLEGIYLTNKTLTRGEIAEILVKAFPKLFKKIESRNDLNNDRFSILIHQFLITKTIKEQKNILQLLITAIEKKSATELLTKMKLEKIGVLSFLRDRLSFVTIPQHAAAAPSEGIKPLANQEMMKEIPSFFRFTRSFKINQQSREIKYLQILLTSLGFYQGTINSKYTQETIDAVYGFQLQKNILTPQSSIQLQ